MKKKAFIYMIVAGMLWGTSGIFVRYLTPLGFTSWQMTAARGTVSFIATAILALFTNRQAFKAKPSHFLIFAAMGLCHFLTAGCYYTSMQLTNIPTAVILMYTAPIYVTILSAIFLKEKITSPKAIAIMVMLVGCALVSGVTRGLSFNIVGVLMGLSSGLAYATYNVLVKVYINKGVSSASISLYSFMFMSIIALIFASPVDFAQTIAKEPIRSLPLLIGLGIVTFVIPYSLFNLSLEHLSAGTVSALGVIEPMSATIYSIVFLDGIPDVASIVGIILVLFAVVMEGIIENKHQNDKITE